MTRMEDHERPGCIQYPANGAKAVNVPTRSVTVNARAGRFSPQDATTRDLSGTTNQSNMEKIRSLVIISDVDFSIDGVWEDTKYFEAGIRKLEGIPETEEFDIDYDVGDESNNSQIKPDEAVTGIWMFNTEYVQFDPSDYGFTAVKDAEVDVTDTSWTTVALQPCNVFSQEALDFKNTGNNELEYRILYHGAGRTRQADLDGQGNKTKTMAAGGDAGFKITRALQFVELQARETTSGNNSTIESFFTGET